jgi:Flp pilus assembly protein TadG
MWPARRADRADRGAAAVELAIVLPLLVLVVMALLDFGRLFFAQVGLASASREGVRAASVGMTTATVTAIAQASAPKAAEIAGLTPGALGVSVTPCSPAVANESTTVTVTATFQWMTPIGLIQVFNPASTRAATLPLSSASEALCL